MKFSQLFWLLPPSTVSTDPLPKTNRAVKTFSKQLLSVLWAFKYWEKKFKNWNAWLVHIDIWEHNVQVFSNQHLAEDCHWTYSKPLDFLSQKQRARQSWPRRRHMAMIAEWRDCCKPVWIRWNRLHFLAELIIGLSILDTLRCLIFSTHSRNSLYRISGIWKI